MCGICGAAVPRCTRSLGAWLFPASKTPTVILLNRAEIYFE
jgi:hypothetical protein